MDWIDLRSDTVTQPTPAMRQAMAEAAVGDDVYGDDPTVNRLERVAAERLGKQAALFVPSGTMGNLVAVLSHCQRGQEVILGDVAHQFMSEAAGMAAVGGVQPRTIPTGDRGQLDPEDIERAIRPTSDPHQPRTGLICLENTHNLRWGGVLTAADVDAVGAVAQAHAIPLHVDGSRIFNAEVATGTPAARLAESADSITFCLSKALCAPVGSVLCGSAAFIDSARRNRKQLGGGMRQAGVLAAAGLIALESMIDRLAEDHARAVELAQALTAIEGIQVLNPKPMSNMVYIEFEEKLAPPAATYVHQAKKAGIKLSMRSTRSMRLVLHYWIGDQALQRVIECMQTVTAAGDQQQ